MIDSHCHLNDERFDTDIVEVIERAALAGVRRIVVVGYGLESSHKAIEIVHAHSGHQGQGVQLHAVVGISPFEAATWDESTRKELIGLAQDSAVVGLGETGLDYYYQEPLPEIQHKCLIGHLHAAMELNLPLVFHLRDAADDFFRILDHEGYSQGGVLHCFTGDERAMQMGIERGLFVSFSGILTFKKAAELVSVARMTPLEHLLVETDAPYLAPSPLRGKRCEPAHVIHTALLLADLKGVSFQALDAQMESNLARLFPGIDKNT